MPGQGANMTGWQGGAGRNYYRLQPAQLPRLHRGSIDTQRNAMQISDKQ